jgi:zinc transport system permease protein
MDDFILRALLAGVLVVLIAAPLGCVVVWRRLAYFGDTLSHAALLGTALGLLLHIEIWLGVFAMGVIISLLMVMLQRRDDVAADTLMGILAHAGLALGLVLLAVLRDQGLRVDLMAYLFGDILAVNNQDLIWMLAVTVLALIMLARLWQSLLAIAVHEELARSEGIAVERVRLMFMLLMVLVVAVAMKIVGVLLITALLIIPAATARRFARSPESMALIAIITGATAIVFGLLASLHWDTPAGPSIVSAAVLLFFGSRLRIGLRK